MTRWTMATRQPKSKPKGKPESVARTRAATPKASARAAPKRASGRRETRSAERREAILAAAMEEFAVNGFAGTRLDDVAQRAGVAKGTIYLYFADKEALL